MAFSINTNNASIEALASLRQTNASLTSTENEISTGKAVNTAADNPAIYAISQTINSQISALSGVSTGLQVSSQIVGIAQTQAASSSTLLSNLAASLSEGQTKGLDPATINDAISATLAQVDGNANGATFKGVNLLAGAVGNGVTSTTAQSAQDVNGTLFRQAGFNATSAGLGLSGLNVNQAGVQVSPGALDSTTTPSTLTLKTTSAANNTGTAQDVATTTKFILNDGAGAGATAIGAALTTALDTNAAATGVTVTDTAGKLTFAGGTAPTQSTDANGNTVYTFASAGNKPVTLTQSKTADGNDSFSVSTATDANGNVTAQTTVIGVNTKPTASTTTNDLTQALATAVSTQGFGVSEDASGNLDIAGGNLDAGSAAITNSTGGTVAQESGSSYALLAVNAAITSINKISSALGSSSNELTGLESTTSSVSDALTSGVGALTDADLASESAKLTSLQTKQQLAIQSLSIANSQSSSLLSLFR